MIPPLSSEQQQKLRERLCPGCGSPVTLMPGMFYTEATGFMDGLVCPNVDCKALWDDPDNSFIAAASRKRVAT